MADIATQTALVVSVGTVALTGTLLGMHYDSLVFGLIGALIMLRSAKETTRIAAMSHIATSMVVAGVGAQILAAILVGQIDSLKDVDGVTLRIASALALGAGWQYAVPLVWARIKKFLRG